MKELRFEEMKIIFSLPQLKIREKLEITLLELSFLGVGRVFQIKRSNEVGMSG